MVEGEKAQVRRDLATLNLRDLPGQVRCEGVGSPRIARDRDAVEVGGGGGGGGMQGREESRFLSSEPWSPGVRNEHEMLGFHVNRF